MATEGKLTGFDYFSRPLLGLQSHSDFSQTAQEVVAKISKMTTIELEALEFITKTGD